MRDCATAESSEMRTILAKAALAAVLAAGAPTELMTPTNKLEKRSGNGGEEVRAR